MEDPAVKLARDIKISDLRKDETQILKGKVSLYKMDGLYEKHCTTRKKVQVYYNIRMPILP